MRARPDDNLVTATRWRGWAVVALGFAMNVVASGPVFYAYGVFVPHFAADFGASRTLINLALTSVLVVSGVASAPIGWLSDRVALHWLALGGVVGTAGGLALVAACSTMPQVVIVYATLISAADVLLGMLVINILIARWFERRRGLAIGLAVLGASVAAILFPPFAAMLDGALGWRRSFLVFAGLAAALTPFVLWLARPPAGGIPSWERRAQPEALLSPLSAHVAPPGWRAYLADRSFWVITVGVGTLMAFNGAAMTSLIPFAVRHGQSPLAAAQLVSITGAAAMAGKFCFGAMADRIDLRWALRLGLLAAALAMGIFSFAPGRPGLVVAAGLFGLGLGAMLPVWGALTARSFGTLHYGRALGATRAMMTPLNLLCPLLVGRAFDLTGDYRAGWAALGVIAVLALLVSFWPTRAPAGTRAR
jgi:MFS family permease